MFKEIKELLQSVVVSWPSTTFGNKLRKKMYSRSLKMLGVNSIFLTGVKVSSSNLVTIGDNCILGNNVCISAGNCYGVFIGDNVSIADGTYMRSANHIFENTSVPINTQGHSAKKVFFENMNYSIVIEDDVWIGARVIILSGAHIGTGSVISAGTVVSSIIPPYSIVVGNPGRVIGNRKNKEKKFQ